MTDPRAKVEALRSVVTLVNGGDLVERAAILAILDRPAPPPEVERLRCAKCGGIDISTRWDRFQTSCSWASRREPGTDGEHLHRHCRNCSYGWGDPIAALSESGQAGGAAAP